MKKKAVILYVGSALVLIVGLVAIDNLAVDGLSGRLLSLCSITDTEYAKGYSDRRFSQLNVGDTEEKARALLGEPLIKGRSRDYEWWNYSRSPHSTHYLYRGLEIKGGVVTAKVSHFYFD